MKETLYNEVQITFAMPLIEEVQNFLHDSREMGKKPILVVLGPTASGKTALAVKLAKQFNGEIISADSRQVYKHMDIGTEKVEDREMEGIRHHLLSVVEPTREFTVADFKRLAMKAINDIHIRQKLPILCGGTGLYINAILDNYQIPQIPPEYGLRQELARYAEEHGAQALHKLLEEKDPQAAKTIHPNNVRYVIRALEINMSGQQKRDTKGERMFNAFAIGVDWPREELYDRINQRAHLQLERGLVNEVKTLLMKGYNESMPAMTSLGYREIMEYIRGETTLEEALEKVCQSTRNYAKRQMTWFRRHQGIHWISPQELQEIVQ